MTPKGSLWVGEGSVCDINILSVAILLLRKPRLAAALFHLGLSAKPFPWEAHRGIFGLIKEFCRCL